MDHDDLLDLANDLGFKQLDVTDPEKERGRIYASAVTQGRPELVFDETPEFILGPWAVLDADFGYGKRAQAHEMIPEIVMHDNVDHLYWLGSHAVLESVPDEVLDDGSMSTTNAAAAIYAGSELTDGGLTQDFTRFSSPTTISGRYQDFLDYADEGPAGRLLEK